MDIQYRPSKSKKEKPVKTPKAPKVEKAMKVKTTVQKVKTSKPAKQQKAPKPEMAKSITFGKPGKVQTDKPMKVEKVNNSGVFSKINPKLLFGGVLVLIAAIAVIVLTVILPAIEEHGQQIEGIYVSSTPDKTVYLVGEEANYDGLRVVVTLNNGETYTVRANKCKLAGFDSSAAVDSQNITVTYEGFTASFFISVKEPPKVTPALKGISLETLPKTEYKLGEWLDTTGGVILREYVDGTTAKITLVNSYVSGFADIDAPGTYELTVRYVEKGIVATTTYTITVTE